MAFEKRILLAATGLSPQIVTESVYACYKDGGLAELPTDIHVITTTEGARRVRESLLSNSPGWFHRLVSDYGLPAINFSDDHIHVIQSPDGEMLEDIRSPSENRSAADMIANHVRRFTRDQNTSLHVSIAGGRKTMGFYMGYALMLYGRPQDRLSHVLVESQYESAAEFYYPSPEPRLIQTRNHGKVDASNAHVVLADIPVVSLRSRLPVNTLEDDTKFESAVAAAQNAVSKPSLQISFGTRTVVAAGVEFKLPAPELALLCVFARRAKNGEPPLQAPEKDAPNADWGERYMAERRTIAGSSQDMERAEAAYKAGLAGDDFSSILSKLRKRLRHELKSQAVHYSIYDGGVRPRKYSLEILPNQIEFIE